MRYTTFPERVENAELLAVLDPEARERTRELWRQSGTKWLEPADLVGTRYETVLMGTRYAQEIGLGLPDIPAAVA